MTVGLKKDQQIKTESIELYKYVNVYLPNNDYYNSEPLPIEWLELIEDPKNLKQNEGKCASFILDDVLLEKYEKRLTTEMYGKHPELVPKFSSSRQISTKNISTYEPPKNKRKSIKNMITVTSQDSLLQNVRHPIIFSQIITSMQKLLKRDFL